MLLSAVLFQLTFVGFVIVRMVFLFFPTMTILASVFQLTPVEIGFSLFFCVPELALLSTFILEEMRLAAEVLPVMCIFTLIPLMVLVLIIERAPDCFEVEHVEVGVLIHLVQHVNAQLIL